MSGSPPKKPLPPPRPSWLRPQAAQVSEAHPGFEGTESESAKHESREISSSSLDMCKDLANVSVHSSNHPCRESDSMAPTVQGPYAANVCCSTEICKHEFRAFDGPTNESDRERSTPATQEQNFATIVESVHAATFLQTLPAAILHAMSQGAHSSNMGGSPQQMHHGVVNCSIGPSSSTHWAVREALGSVPVMFSKPFFRSCQRIVVANSEVSSSPNPSVDWNLNRRDKFEVEEESACPYSNPFAHSLHNLKSPALSNAPDSLGEPDDLIDLVSTASKLNSASAGSSGLSRVQSENYHKPFMRLKPSRKKASPSTSCLAINLLGYRAVVHLPCGSSVEASSGWEQASLNHAGRSVCCGRNGITQSLTAPQGYPNLDYSLSCGVLSQATCGCPAAHDMGMATGSGLYSRWQGHRMTSKSDDETLRIREFKVCCQAATCMLTAVTEKIECCGRSGQLNQVLKTWFAVGCVVHCSSLLTAMGKELEMLSDGCVAIWQCRRIRIRLFFEPADGQKVYSPSSPVVQSIRGCSISADPSMPEWECLRIDLQMSNSAINVGVDDGLADALANHGFGLIPIVSSFSVNERSVLMKEVGHTLQKTLNDSSLKIISILAKSKLLTMNGELVVPQYNPKSDKDSQTLWLLKLSRQVSSEPLYGARLTFCKSGKDRTAMLCTLEAADRATVVLHAIKKASVQKHGLRKEHTEHKTSMIATKMHGWERGLDVANSLRLYGVRRQVCAINNSAALNDDKYAFNSVQMGFFPHFLRPPAATLANSLQYRT